MKQKTKKKKNVQTSKLEEPVLLILQFLRPEKNIFFF